MNRRVLSLSIVVILTARCGGGSHSGDGSIDADVVDVQMTDGATDQGPRDTGRDGSVCTPGCVAGQECVNGTCQCTTHSCTGCCNGAMCVYVSGESNALCGTGGVACAACTGATPTCTSGACADTCGASGNGTCTVGCCGAGHCDTGAAATACGTSGGACVDCTLSHVGHACVSGRCGCDSNTDCPSGQSCNTTTHECACGPTSCPNGCCDPTTGACVTPSSTACGTNGATCAACATGQHCANGSCTCDPTMCAGCCSGASCIPLASETMTSCGTGGATCAACTMGQACQNGACGCDATSCPNGCCAAGVCVPYASQSNMSCGTAGATCGSCAAGQSCANGACGCSGASCPSGCCSSGQCIATGSQGTMMCGTGGAACGMCGAGQACVGGACVCNATSCPNGCCQGNTCVPYTSQNAMACGTAGAICGSCGAGQACTGGSCGCGSASCNGCCSSGSCVSLTSETNGSCGVMGAACAPCSGQAPTCAAGVCTGACGGTGNGTCASGCCSTTGCAGGMSPTACGASGGACVDCTMSAIGHACVAGVCGCSGNGDCPTGSTCNLSSHTCGSCNGITCPNGCCDTNGVCQMSETAAACGMGGNACATCGAGQDCVAAACACTTTSCGGCCSGTTCVPTGSQSAMSCGAGGAMCAGCASDPNGAACVAGHCGCMGASDCAAGSVCSTATGTCVANGACSNGLCNGCCDASGTCQSGTAPSACGVLGGACSDCTANVPICHATGTCSAGACTYPVAAPGVACSTDFCSVGQTCDGAGNCSGGTPRDCSMGNACQSCTCSSANGGSCNCTTRTVNAMSAVQATSTCLTVGTTAQLAIVVTLVDSAGAPVTGATVNIAASNAAVTWLEPQAVEVPSPAGAYYRTMLAPSGTGSTTVNVSATACGSTVPLATSPTINFVAGAPTSGFEGVAGCSPVAGNLRVRVIEQETGNPISGASVLVGSAMGAPFVTSAAQLFPTPNAMGTNVGTTDASGYVQFIDFGTGGLRGAQIVTAASTNRANKTLYHFNGSDEVIALPLRRPTMTTYAFTNGVASNRPTAPDCTWVEAGLALEDTTLDAFTSFNTGNLLSPNKCLSAAGMNLSMPGNLYLPMQTIGPSAPFLCIASINSPWQLQADAGSREFEMPFVRVPFNAATTGNIVTMLQQAVWQSIGYQARNVTAAVANDSIALGDTYPVHVTYNFSNNPPNTDIIGGVAVDYSGGDGTGALGINAVQFHLYNATGTSIQVPVATVTGAPAGTTHLGAVIANFTAPIAPRTTPLDQQAATSAVLIRGTPGNPPFGTASSATFTVNTFMGLPTAVTDTTNTVFTFADATNGASVPQFSVSTLVVQHSTYHPLQSCETTPDKTNVNYTQWVVVRPHADDGANCASLNPVAGSCEAFTLPALPSTFPYAMSGTQQQSGFEQFVGSGATCTSTCALSTEMCHSPTNATTDLQCMGYDGTNYFEEHYVWMLQDDVLGLAPTAVAAGAADFTQVKPGLTLVATNSTTF